MTAVGIGAIGTAKVDRARRSLTRTREVWGEIVA
jgi:hypothetical protein